MDLLTRSAGGLLGVDVRNPQEKLQAEMAQVKDPMSVEGMLKRAQILASTGDPKALMTATALANEARTLRTAKLEKERIASGRAANLEWLKRNAPDKVPLYENYGMSDAVVSRLQTEDAISKAATARAEVSAGQKRIAMKTVLQTYGLPPEEEAKLLSQIDNKTLDPLTFAVFEKTYKPEEEKANNKNWVIQNISGDTASGTRIQQLRTDDYGRVYDKASGQFVNPIEVGAIRLAGRGSEAEEEEAPDTKATLRAAAAGGALNFAAQLSGLDMSELGATLALVESPTARTLGGVFDSETAKRANQIKIAKDNISQSVGRDLSGGQIKEQEMKDFRVQLVPTFTDFSDNNAIFTKLVNTSLGLSIAADTALARGAKATEGGVVPFTSKELTTALADIAAVPVTPEIQDLVDSGQFDKAIQARIDQVLSKGKTEETREEKLARIRAKHTK
tara:strand:- start:2888 stop:4231 length:1344 start_codon:yes stop_codon:yes gene_type:complete